LEQVPQEQKGAKVKREKVLDFYFFFSHLLSGIEAVGDQDLCTLVDLQHSHQNREVHVLSCSLVSPDPGEDPELSGFELPVTSHPTLATVMEMGTFIQFGWSLFPSFNVLFSSCSYHGYSYFLLL